MFRCINVKSEFYNKFKAKINRKSQKQQILNSCGINFTNKINHPLNPPKWYTQFYNLLNKFWPSEIETKHTSGLSKLIDYHRDENLK